jgi:Zn-dependent protease with chaperone function
MLALFSSIVLCALLLWLLFGAIAALGYRFVRPRLRAIDPAQASQLLLGWLALPPFASLLSCYVLYSPDLAQWLVGGHCHLNNCRVHGPQSDLAIIPAALLTVWTLFSVGRCFLRLWLPARRLEKQLCLVGNYSGEFVSLDSAEPVAFTLGCLRPRIFISAGMLSACSTQEIDCIVRHERAHRRRHDNLRLLLAGLFSAPLPRRWALPAVFDLKLSCEKACDLSAAAELSRAAVAAALIRVARIQQSPSPSASLAFVGNQTEQRILALLGQPQAPMANELVFATVSVTLLVILAMINPLHQAVELLP